MGEHTLCADVLCASTSVKKVAAVRSPPLMTADLNQKKMTAA
jgi:hypothetical protein